MLLRRKRKEGRRGRKEVGERKMRVTFSICHSATVSLSVMDGKERIQVGVMDGVTQSGINQSCRASNSQIPTRSSALIFAQAARGTGH